MGEEKLLPRDSGLRLQVTGASRDKGRGSSVHLAGAVRGVTLTILCGHTDGGNIYRVRSQGSRIGVVIGAESEDAYS